jgi:hypothetical protein
MLVVSAEIASGYLFSDDYDKLIDPIATPVESFGLAGNDWYLFPNLTITYTFGPKF